MAWWRRTAVRLAVLVALPATLAGCSIGDHRTLGLTASSAPVIAATDTASPATASATSGTQPFWEGSVAFAGGSGDPVLTRVRLYPLQRVGTRVLLTVDLKVQSSAGRASLHPFCTGDDCWDLSGISLVDTASLTRFGPSQAGVAGGLTMTSSTRGPGLSPGRTYRFGAVFADPGTSRVAVDLQQAGVVLGVPIGTGQLPAANLISTVGPAARWNPEPVTAGSLVTAPLPALTGAFFDDRHPLVTSVTGPVVSATPGIVTLRADAVFAAGSGTPDPAAVASSGVLARIAKALAGRVDPGRPMLVIGYSDASGDPAGSLALTQQRARAVAGALGLRLKRLTFVTSGRGQADPIAANTTSTGQDSPSGRSLNRRIVIAYAPKAASAPTASTFPTGSPAGAGASSVLGSGAVSTPAAGADQDAAPALVRVGPSVVSSRGRAAKLSAGVSAVRVDGGLSLVTLELRSDRQFTPAAAFGTGPTASPATPAGVGAFHLIDRATRQVFVPARDADDQTRVLGVFTHRMEPRITYRYSFFTAALPDGLRTVDVALADLGTARAVQVQR